MGYTKESWAINGSTYTGYLEAESIMDSDGREVLYATHDGTFVIENSADAHLIASAPELLDALKMVLSDDVPMRPDTIHAIRAAIAKAEGKS